MANAGKMPHLREPINLLPIMKIPKLSLLAKVAIAIVAGIAFGQFLPTGIVRVFVTFNSLFANFLSFSDRKSVV